MPLADGVEALAVRLLLAEQAERSIDVQYFLTHDDVVRRADFDLRVGYQEVARSGRMTKNLLPSAQY